MLELLMIIISCHVFLTDKNSAAILSCRIIFFDYYVSKDLVRRDNNSSVLNNVPQRVKQIINAEQTYKNYFEMACYSAIPSAADTLKSITIFSGLYKDFASKGHFFRYIFVEYIKPYMR